MTGPQPPEPPYSPQFRVPAMSPAQPGAFDDPEARRKRMRMGILGGAIGLGIPLLIAGIGLAVGLADTSSTGTDRWISTLFVLLGGTVLVSPAQIIAGIVLTAVQKTRPFGVGFLIGSAIGLIIMAGACFTIPAVFP